jgi:hypothetical protein
MMPDWLTPAILRIAMELVTKKNPVTGNTFKFKNSIEDLEYIIRSATHYRYDYWD